MSAAMDSGSSGLTTPPSTIIRSAGVMPRPGQPGAPFFDNTNVTEFLRRWNLECEDFGLTDRQKCARLPDYCTPKTKDVVELLDGYKNSNWARLQEELKGLFWQYDRQKDTPAALNELIHDAPNLDLNVYVLKYTSITGALVRGKDMSTTQRVRRFLDGLSDSMHDKAFEFCTKQDWKLSSHDTGSKDPDFDELKKFILAKAQSAKRKVVYNKERALEDGFDGLQESVSAIARPNSPVVAPVPPTPTIPASVAQPTPTPIATTPSDPAIAELSKQFSQLALLLKANIENGRSTVPTAPAATAAPQMGVPFRPINRPLQCMWCDAMDHSRYRCPEFPGAIQKGLIRLNEQNRVVNVETGLELPLMFGRGGMKKLLDKSIPSSNSVFSATTTNITIDDLYGQLGDNSVMVTTLDFENDTRSDEIIDIDVWEKRKHGGSDKGRRVKPRYYERSTPEFNPTDSGPSQSTQPSSFSPSQPERSSTFPRAQSLPPRPVLPEDPTVPHLADDSDEEMVEEPASPVGRAKRKYRLASKINETVTIADVGEKIMDTPIQLNLRELCAVSPEISGYMHGQTKKHRMPIESTIPAAVVSSANESTTPAAIVNSANESTTPVPTVNSANESTTPTAAVNSAKSTKPLYACPSGRAKVILNGELRVNALLDNGSEVNIMSGRLFEQLDNPPIDTDVTWRINAFNTSDGAETSGLLGLCHKMSVDIGGVEVYVPIFVVKDSVQDLLLGRPWE